VGGQRHVLAAFPPGKDPVTIVEVDGWAPGPVRTGAENVASNGFRSPALVTFHGQQMTAENGGPSAQGFGPVLLTW